MNERNKGMTLRRRLGIAVLLMLPAMVAYALGRYYSPDLISLVVEQSLVEKAPPGTDSKTIQSRFQSLMAGYDTREAKMSALLQLSQYLEKIQQLSLPELEALLRGTPPGSARQVL
jgi:hypothetical protein